MSITSSNHHFTTFDYVWRFGEVHADKLVLFLMTVVAVVKVKTDILLNKLKWNFILYRYQHLM
jgi:hypothetical protein